MDERQLKWDRRYIRLAREVGTWSKDPSTQVGAVLVRPEDNSVVSTGFNGFPPGHPDILERYLDRGYKHSHVVHAEENALNFFGSRAEGFTLYTSFPCCPRCVEKAGRHGVARIVHPPLQTGGRSTEWLEEWIAQLRNSLLIAIHLGIDIVVVYE